MTVKKPIVIVTRKLPRAVETVMQERFDVRLNDDDHLFSRDELVKAVRIADILVPTVTDRINNDLLAEAGAQLRLIANYGVGVNNIDLPSCRDQGIMVTNTPDVLTDDTADIALALILNLLRRLGEGERMIRSNGWRGFSPTAFLGRRLGGKKLGIVGLGRIGLAVARRAAAFGMLVHYYNRNRLSAELEKEMGLVWHDELDNLLVNVDIVTLHCPATPSTFHLLDQRRLKLLQPHGFVVNTARGDVLDEDALIRMLEKGELAGAGLDVYQDEPNVNPKLLAMENVVLFPHLGSATEETREAMGRRVIGNIQAFVENKTPPDRITAGAL